MSQSAADAAKILAEQFLIKEANLWGIRVHRRFDATETRLIFPYAMMKSDGDLETISPQGLLLASTHLPRKRTAAIATFPFKQDIPVSQARRYLSRDIGCKVLNQKEDGSIALVEANVVDLNEGWYKDCMLQTIDETANTALVGDISGAGVEPEAITEFRSIVQHIFGAEADKLPIMVCTRQHQNPGLVFVGRAEDVHLFLRNEAVRKHLHVSAWTQRGYAARNRSTSFLCSLCACNAEVELGPWSEMIAMYQDPHGRTLTTVQTLEQFRREKQLGEDVTEAFQAVPVTN